MRWLGGPHVRQIGEREVHADGNCLVSAAKAKREALDIDIPELLTNP
jgi:hypothetical protein